MCSFTAKLLTRECSAYRVIIVIIKGNKYKHRCYSTSENQSNSEKVALYINCSNSALMHLKNSKMTGTM